MRYAAWLFFSKTWTLLNGQFEEEATPQDVEAQTPQAFEVQSAQEADVAEVILG